MLLSHESCIYIYFTNYIFLICYNTGECCENSLVFFCLLLDNLIVDEEQKKIPLFNVKKSVRTVYWKRVFVRSSINHYVLKNDHVTIHFPMNRLRKNVEIFFYLENDVSKSTETIE